VEKILKTQEELDSVIKSEPMTGNIYYDKNMKYKPINWNKEFIKITNSNNTTIIERIKIK